MKSTILKFISLPELAQFVEQVKPAGYLLNTMDLTINAKFSESEIDAAIEQWNAKPLQFACEPKRELVPLVAC